MKLSLTELRSDSNMMACFSIFSNVALTLEVVSLVCVRSFRIISNLPCFQAHLSKFAYLALKLKPCKSSKVQNQTYKVVWNIFRTRLHQTYKSVQNIFHTQLLNSHCFIFISILNKILYTISHIRHHVK